MEQINIDELAKGISDNLKQSDTFEPNELIDSLSSSLLDLNKKYEKPTTLIKMAANNNKIDSINAQNCVYINGSIPHENIGVDADNTLINESLSREVDRALATLTERERDIIKLFFGISTQEMTLEEIGEKFGLTRERVRQIKEKAIRRLRHTSRSKLLKTYLG